MRPGRAVTRSERVLTTSPSTDGCGRSSPRSDPIGTGTGMSNAEATPPTQELPIEAPGAAPPSPEHRYRALAGAVRRHESASSHPAVPRRPLDHALYAALRDLGTDPPGRRDP